MRIFYAAHDQGNSNPESLTWFHNLYLPLKDIADEVIRFDFDLFPVAIHQDFTRIENLPIIEYLRPKLEKELLKQIEETHKQKPVNLFFSYFSSSFCSPEVIEQIKAMGIITINWFCNASYQFYLIKELAPVYDFCLVPELYRIEDYKKEGANPIYCQEAANPTIYKPYNGNQDIEVSFVGTKYADRAKYIYSLNYSGKKVNVWGQNWRNTENENRYFKLVKPFYHRLKKIKLLSDEKIGNFISDEEMVKVFNRSKINLGFTNCWLENDSNPIPQVRLRDFEVPMSGGFYLTQFNEELLDYFEPDKEIVYFNNIKDCIDKTKYYLNKPIERERIRKAGFQRAIKDHSWQKRLSDIFTFIGFNNFHKEIYFNN